MREYRCPICNVSGGFPHDHKPDLSGLDDGPYLPRCAPRKKPSPKPPKEIARIRAAAWASRRALYGQYGHR